MSHSFELLTPLALGSDLCNRCAGCCSYLEVLVLQRIDQNVLSLTNCLLSRQPTKRPDRHAFNLWLVCPRSRFLIWLLSKVLDQVVNAWQCFRHSYAADGCDNNFLHLRVFFLDELSAKRLDNRFADHLSACLFLLLECLAGCVWHDACVLDELGLHTVNIEVLENTSLALRG